MEAMMIERIYKMLLITVLILFIKDQNCATGKKTMLLNNYFENQLQHTTQEQKLAPAKKLPRINWGVFSTSAVWFATFLRMSLLQCRLQ